MAVYNVTLEASFSVDVHAEDEDEAVDVARAMGRDISGAIWPYNGVYIYTHTDETGIPPPLVERVEEDDEL